MNLFKELAPFLTAYNMKMVISQNEGQIAVAFTPVFKKDVSNVTDTYLHPMIFTGTPEELDEQIINMIKTPLVKTEGIVTNIRFYAEQLKKKEDEAKAKTEAKKTVAPTKALTTAAKPTTPALFEEEEGEENDN